jgi:hypothetical protein
MIPGWGQYYAGSKLKGKFLFSSLFLFSGYFAYTMGNFSSAQANYNSTFALPTTPYYYESLLLVQSAREDLQSTRQEALIGAGALAGFWLYNLIDAGFVTDLPKEDFFSFGIKPKLVPMQTYEVPSATTEGYAYFNYVSRF